jgi:hypothetical protein
MLERIPCHGQLWPDQTALDSQLCSLKNYKTKSKSGSRVRELALIMIYTYIYLCLHQDEIRMKLKGYVPDIFCVVIWIIVAWQCMSNIVINPDPDRGTSIQETIGDISLIALVTIS